MLTFGFFPKIKYTQNSELVSNENVKWNETIVTIYYIQTPILKVFKKDIGLKSVINKSYFSI
jgi:hypothetical protein